MEEATALGIRPATEFVCSLNKRKAMAEEISQPFLALFGKAASNLVKYFAVVKDARTRCKYCKKRLSDQLDIIKRHQYAVNLDFLLYPTDREELEAKFKDCEKEVGDLQEAVSKAADSLKRLPTRLTWPCFETNLEKRISELDEQVRELNDLCEREKAKSANLERRKKAVLDWLETSGDCNNATRHSEFLKTMQNLGSGLGDWFQQHKDFHAWFEGTGPSLLVCYGPEGMGKTSLMSNTVNYLLYKNIKQQHMAVIYYYTDSPTTRMITVVGELLRQLVSVCPKLPWLVDNVFERRRPNVIPNFEGFLELFTSFPEAAPMSVFVVIDSLEAIHASKSEVRKLLQTLSDIKGYRVLVSMNEDYFQELLHDDILDDNEHCAIKLDHHVAIQSVERYVRTQLDRQPITRADSTLREGVTRRIISMIGRFSFIQGDIQLNYVLEGNTPQEIEKRLQSTPNNANELYQTCLNLIENSKDYNRNLAVKALSWLHYSRELEPLTMLQLRQALAFHGDYLEYPDYISSQTIRDSCQRLVSVRGNIVRFTDPAFDDYLTEHPPRDFLSLEALAETCLASLRYALRGDENRTLSPGDPTNGPSFNEHAAEFWASYASQADTNNPSLRKKIFEFLLNPKRREELINILSNKRVRDVNTQQLPPILEDLSSKQTVLHILIRNDLDDLALLLINSPNEVLDILDIRPNYVEDALRNLGNAKSTDAEHQTPLHYAVSRSSNCNDKLVFALLKHGALISAKNRMGYTPLHCSAYSGNQRAIEIFLAEHVDLNEKGCESATALHIAAARGHLQLMEFLHSKGANVSCTDKKSLNPLHYATAYGQVEAMQFILQQRPDLLNAGPMSPLHKAAETFQFEALKFLLENDADVMSKATVHIFNLPDVTPLEIAIRRGAVYAAEDLISKGAHLTIDTNWFRTECRWAHLTGNSEMFMERVQSKCGKASEEWSKKTDEHGRRLRVHQLEHLLREHQPHPALATLLAKEWSDEAYGKIQAARRLFEEYCVVDTEAKAAQINEGNNLPLKISDVIHLKLRCNKCLMYPLRGFRHKCTICPRFDLCEDCYKQAGTHQIEHILLKIPTLKWLQENEISTIES